MMFGSELDKTESPEVLTAGLRTFDDLLDTIVRCQDANLLPAGDPREIAGPIWSLLHGISMLTIGSDLSHVGIREEPEALTERALRECCSFHHKRNRPWIPRHHLVSRVDAC